MPSDPNPLCTYLGIESQHHDSGLCYYRDGEGEPLVMVHGNPTWSFLYRYLFDQLRSSFQVVAYDHLGCGYSARPDSVVYPYTLQARIVDLLTLVDYLFPKERLTLIMHDWGVAIGLGYASRFPKRIKQLVILNGAAFHLPVGKRFPWQLGVFRNRYCGRFFCQQTSLFLKAVLSTCSSYGLTAEVAEAYCHPYQTANDRLAIWKFVEDIPLVADDASYQTLQKIEQNLERLVDVTMMFCWGAKDFIFDDDFLNYWQELFPNACYRVYQEAGHLVPEDAPSQLVEDLGDFLNG